MRTEVNVLRQVVSGPVRESVAERLRGLSRFHAGTLSVRAVLAREAAEQRVELVASLRRGAVVVVEGRAPDLPAALDDAFGRMGRVLARRKDRTRLGARRGARARSGR